MAPTAIASSGPPEIRPGAHGVLDALVPRGLHPAVTAIATAVKWTGPAESVAAARDPSKGEGGKEERQQQKRKHDVNWKRKLRSGRKGDETERRTRLKL